MSSDSESPDKYIPIKPRTNIFRQYRDPTTNRFITLSANDFIKIWKHYDNDGNGHIEGQELDDFIVDLLASIIPPNSIQNISKLFFENFKISFMKAYDDNGNGRLEVKELAQLVPLEENFSIIFDGSNHLKSSVYFMKLWKKYDADKSGSIDASEFISLLRDFYAKVRKKNIKPEQLQEIADIVLEIFDSNKDGKLQIGELAKLFPVESNYLKRIKLMKSKKIKTSVINRIFKKYDIDGNGQIENEELEGFLKDLVELQTDECELGQIEVVKKLVLRSCDMDRDGRISKKELIVILNSIVADKKDASKRRRNILLCS
ncbi:calbindin-32 [Tetranychus urticae]|uniref:EF-hand domain-containing protein n=1 Tax=Tetranychus urticae TaxID=32264 RepID=T1L196_TETUR|nr:calbindin-32 [Tetranychus urticae]